MSSTPVGWAGLAGVAAGYGAVKLFQWGYDSNFLGMKDGIDWIGSKVDDGIDWGVNKAKESGKWLLDRASDVGQAFSDGFSFINPFD